MITNCFLKVSTKAIKKLNTDNEERSNEINNQLIKLAIENEKQMREAITNKKLLQITKEECKRQIGDLEGKISKERDKLKIEEQLVIMQMEDAFSVSMRWQERYNALKGKYDNL